MCEFREPSDYSWFYDETDPMYKRAGFDDEDEGCEIDDEC